MEENAKYGNDIAFELARLHVLHGMDFTNQLKLITRRKEFLPVKDEDDIYSAISESDADYPSLLNAAQKAVSHGYRVFILPNPKGIRTADFIFERKGVYRMYDLKTIQGRSSIINRLIESIGQSNHILLNMATDYNARLLALQKFSRSLFLMVRHRDRRDRSLISLNDESPVPLISTKLYNK